MKLITLLFLLNAISWGRAPDYDVVDKSLQPPDKPILTYSDVKKLIADKQIKSPDELIVQLKQKYRDNVTLAYQSRSLQFADCEHPRIVFYGPDAKLLMAFAGSAELPGGNTVEITEWKPEQKEFEYHEIAFPSATDNGGQSCMACHGEKPRPNWDAYNGWQGLFGSLSRLKLDVIAKGSKEMACFKTFLARSAGKGRYASINVKSFADSPAPGDLNVQLGAFRDANSRVTHFISLLNEERVANLINTLPRHERNKYLVAALVSGCGFKDAIAALLPQGARDELFAKLKRDFARRKSKLQDFNPIRNETYQLQDFSVASANSAAKWYAAKEILGLDLTELSTGFIDGDYDFSTPQTEFWRGVQAYLSSELEKDPDLAPLMEKGSCKAFARKITELAPIEITQVKQPHALRLCISCHAAPNNTGPAIPFHQPEKLTSEQLERSAALMSSRSKAERMPKDYPALSEKEQSDILTYLKLFGSK